MSNKINIRSVKMEWLNSRCLTQVSKYAKLAHDYDGTVINLREEDVLGQIRDHANLVDDSSLRDVYKQVKIEVKNCLADPGLSKEVLEEAIPAYLISGHDEDRVSRKEIISRWFGLG
ncbi:MAG: hypothetical protein KTR16_15850 [Acidiferrobacterales bacterium]|nr:hypothetical protein [Acidiferrobacterales bacterium]